MKKTLCALVVGASVFTPIIAMAADTDVKIYGRANLSVDVLDDGKDYQELGLSSNSSRLGFKAEKKLDDLTVFAQIETEINFAQGEGNVWAGRDTFAGIKGNFGQIKAGRFDSPFKVARGPVNFFGDMVGDLRNVTRAGDLRFDERNANTIEYKAPKYNGFVFSAAVALHEGATAGTATSVENGAQKGDNNKNQAYDLAVNYKEGPIDFAAAYESYQDDATRGGRDSFRVAGAYKLTPELNLGAIYQLAQHDNDKKNPDVNVYGIAGEYKLTPKTTVRGQYLIRDVDAADSNSDLIAVGLEHRLDSTFRVYGNLATVLNDKKAKLTPWEQARTNNVGGTLGEDALALSVGMRYDF